MMSKSTVYFTDFRTKAFGDGLPNKLRKLIRRAGIERLNMDGKFVAIKMHFGEHQLPAPELRPRGGGRGEGAGRQALPDRL